MFHSNKDKDTNINTTTSSSTSRPLPPRIDDPLQQDSLDRGGEGDLRTFLPGQGPATGLSGGHITTAGQGWTDQGLGAVGLQQQPQQHQVWTERERGDVVTRNEQLGSVVSGGQYDTTSTRTAGTGMGYGDSGLRQQQSSELDAPGASLGERLKNAVVQTIHDAQTGRVGNDLPPGHFEHATTHVNLHKTMGAESNPPDLLRDQDFEQRSRDHGHKKRSNFELSDAGRVEILPTSLPNTDMGTMKMGVPAKSGYEGGVGHGHIDTTNTSATSWIPGTAGENRVETVGRDRSMTSGEWDKSQQHSGQYGYTEGVVGTTQQQHGYAQGTDPRHWTEKAADIIEDTKAKISETTHAAVNMAKGKGHSGSTGL
jgi:hypothetical protein